MGCVVYGSCNIFIVVSIISQSTIKLILIILAIIMSTSLLADKLLMKYVYGIHTGPVP